MGNGVCWLKTILIVVMLFARSGEVSHLRSRVTFPLRQQPSVERMASIVDLPDETVVNDKAHGVSTD